MTETDTFKTVSGTAKGLYRDKGSKFIGLVFPVGSEEEVRGKITELKKEYFDANHHCYAYRIGKDNPVSRMNDDGEPSGSAGKPIHGQILSKELTNVLVVVIRYFGGTKLGIPGLVKAYKTTAKEVLDSVSFVSRSITEKFELTFDYLVLNDVMRILKEEHVEFISKDIGNTCRICFFIRRNRIESLKSKVKSLIKQETVFMKKS